MRRGTIAFVALALLASPAPSLADARGGHDRHASNHAPARRHPYEMLDVALVEVTSDYLRAGCKLHRGIREVNP